jgi:DNA-binding MarR family transcriptional regulator
MTGPEVTLRTQRQGSRRAAEPTPFLLESHVFYYFTQILARRQRALNSELRRFGLDYARWRVMAVLNEEPDCSMQRLSDHTSVDRTTLTHMTPRGRDMLAQILPTVLAQTDLALDGFTPGEVDRLREQLGRIVANLKR